MYWPNTKNSSDLERRQLWLADDFTVSKVSFKTANFY